MKGNAPDWWGEIPSVADRPDRGSLRRGARDQGSQRRALVAAAPAGHRRRPFRVPPHDLAHAGARRNRRRSRPIRCRVLDDETRPGRCTRSAATPTSSIRKSARLLKAGSSIVSDSVHLHSNGRDTKAHLEIGFKLHAEGLQADVQARAYSRLGNGVDIDIRGDGSEPAAARLHRAAARTPRSSRSSRTCTRRARGCASRRSGATTSRR